MTLLDLTYYGNPVLRSETVPVDTFDDELAFFAQDMLDTMYENNGIGLAAPQVGIVRSIIVIDIAYVGEAEEHDPIILVNPEIYEFSGSVVMEEGCLSMPDVHVEVERPEVIKLRYQDTEGNRCELKTDGLLARVILHEVDHLKGRLMTDYLSPVKRNLIKTKLQKIAKGEIPLVT